jgi:hypothetical protein
MRTKTKGRRGAAPTRPDFRKIADRARRWFRESLGVRLGYDEKSLLRVDGILSRFWRRRWRNPPDLLVSAWGAYLGECLCELLGAKWRFRDGGWVLELGEMQADPFARVRNRFDGGMENAIDAWYAVLSAFAPKRPPKKRNSGNRRRAP